MNMRAAHYAKQTYSRSPIAEPPLNELLLLRYAAGWKRGVMGAAYSESEMNDQDFSAGYSAGRDTVLEFNKAAAEKYKCEISPLRGGS